MASYISKGDDDDWFDPPPVTSTWATLVSSIDNLTFTGLLSEDGLLIYRRNAFGFCGVDEYVMFEDDEADQEEATD